MTPILDFANYAMSKVFFDHTTMSGMPKNPIVDTKKTTKICYYSKENDINLLFDLEYMTNILDFTHNAMS